MKPNNNSRPRSSIIPRPPQFTSSFIVRKKLRFKAAAAGTTALTPASFGDLWCVAATATSAYQLAQFVRLRKIEMWGPMASDLVPVTVSCDWTGSANPGTFGRSNRVSDTSIGASEPAYISTSPPAGTQISEWLASNSPQALCSLTYPLGTVIDVTYELVVRDDGTANAVTGAVAGATVGANYVRALDSVSATNLVPISYSTI